MTNMKCGDFYKVGMRICLDHMDDPQAPADNSTGEIQFIDGIGQLHIKWDNTSSSLAIIPDLDKFHLIDTNQKDIKYVVFPYEVSDVFIDFNAQITDIADYYQQDLSDYRNELIRDIGDVPDEFEWYSPSAWHASYASDRSHYILDRYIPILQINTSPSSQNASESISTLTPTFYMVDAKTGHIIDYRVLQKLEHFNRDLHISLEHNDVSSWFFDTKEEYPFDIEDIMLFAIKKCKLEDKIDSLQSLEDCIMEYLPQETRIKTISEVS